VKFLNLEDLNWSNIEYLKDYHITYLLYKEGKSINAISSIRALSKTDIEKHIIKGKIEFNKSNDDLLLKIISMNKLDRLDYIKRLTKDEKVILYNEIYKRYITFKNPDDRMIIIWIIGELKDKRLLPFLRMELRSKNVNFRRLAVSALGKIKDTETKPWLEYLTNDSNPQVRQYAIKSLGFIGDENTIMIFRDLLKKEHEKEYVRKAIYESIDLISKKILLMNN